MLNYFALQYRPIGTKVYHISPEIFDTVIEELNISSNTHSDSFKKSNSTAQGN